MQGERYGEGLRLPRLAEHRALLVTRDAGNGVGGAARRGRIDGHAGSRYGSKASTETVRVGSASAPQSWRPSNTTV